METSENLPLSYEINPRGYSVDKGIYGFFGIWFTLAIGFGVIGLWQQIWWFFGCVLGITLLAIIAICDTWKRIDTLEVTAKGLILKKNHQPIPGVLIKKGSTVELILDYEKGFDSRSATSLLSFFETSSGFRRKHYLGQRINEEGRNKIYYEIKSFLTQHGFNVEGYNYLEKQSG